MNQIKTEKKHMTYTILVIILGCLTYVFLSFFMDFEKIKQAFQDYHYLYFFFAAVIIAATWLIESFMLKIVVSDIAIIDVKKTFKIAMITQFFNLITPFYTGGQPFTIYYFSKEGVEYEQSIAAILFKSFTFQLSLTILGLLTLFLSWGALATITRYVAIAGIAINTGIAFLMFFFGKHKKTVDFIVNGIVRLLEKFKIIKNSEALKDNVNQRATEFIKMFESFGNQKGTLIKLTVLNLINYSLYILSAIVILRGTGITLNLELFCRTTLLNISSSVIPTPGTAGGIEGFYFLFLNALIDKNTLTLTVFLWRMSSYYLNILFSGLFVVITIFKKEKKQKVV